MPKRALPSPLKFDMTGSLRQIISGYSMAGNYRKMQTHWCSQLCKNINRVLYIRVPKWLVYTYVMTLVSAYIFVTVHTPMAIQPDGAHDDEFYMSHGRYLAEGEWLGPFSQFTLMKGPGYPAFLAIGNWLGIPVSLAHALFRSGAVIFFVLVAHRFIKSLLLSGIFFALLLWQPVTLILVRVLREQIYPAQVLLVFAATASALFLSPEWKQRIIFGTLTGFFLVWFWLTREENVWILPGLALLIVPAAWQAYRQHQLRELTATLSIALAVFVVTQAGFRAANWQVYGKFVGVDFKEKNFQKALQALDSVRSGGVQPYVSVTRAARERVYAVSPNFASLRVHFEGPASDGWRDITCKFYPASCGEIAAGWFVWDLRDAAAGAGHYVSPKEASAFFRRIANEISAACANGRLECVPQLIPELPPVTWEQLAREIPPRYVDAFNLLVNLEPPLQLEKGSGVAETLAHDLQFLNYPAHTLSARMPEQTTSLHLERLVLQIGLGLVFCQR